MFNFKHTHTQVSKKQIFIFRLIKEGGMYPSDIRIHRQIVTSAKGEEKRSYTTHVMTKNSISVLSNFRNAQKVVTLKVL